jgi:hypothetical protein
MGFLKIRRNGYFLRVFRGKLDKGKMAESHGARVLEGGEGREEQGPWTTARFQLCVPIRGDFL